VLVHDAARPNATEATFEAVTRAVREGADAAVPAVPVVDTLRRVGGGTVDRSELVAVQTPQAFRAEVLRRAHEGAPDATDDAGLVERVGGTVGGVPGDRADVKRAGPTGLVVLAALRAERAGGARMSP